MDNELVSLITETGRISDRILEGDQVRPGCLGRLYGPIAEWNAPTRNGRYYSRELWTKVFDTPWVQEALQRKTLFGEADHPEERLESLLSEAAVVMTQYEFNDDDSTLYGWFDILDTPSGRILRALADYGCELGVSSRGRGRLVKRGDTQAVEESSYVFGGFDIVALPAVQKARQNFVAENADIENIDKSFTDQISDQIKECKSLGNLEVIKRVLESSELSSDEFTPLIESKFNELSHVDDNTIVDNLTDELQNAYKQIDQLKSQINEKVDTIDEDMDRENVKILSDLYQENSELKSRLVVLEGILPDYETYMGLRNEHGNLADKIDFLIDQNQRLIDQNRELTASIDELTSKIAVLKKRVRSVKVHFEKEKDNLIQDHQKAVEGYNNEIDKLNQDLVRKDNRFESLEKRFNENVRDYNQLLDTYTALTEEYVSVKSQASGVDENTVRRLLPSDYSINDIDQIVESQRSLKRRLQKLPIIQSDLSESAVVSTSDDSLKKESNELEMAERILTSMP